MFESSEISKRSPPVKLPNRVSEVVQDAPEKHRKCSPEKPLGSDSETKKVTQHQTKQSTAGQSSLPLQWIDEQELSQNNSNSGLRKTIRSYARRDTTLRQQRLNAASKPGSKTPRNIAEKSGPDKQGPASDQDCQAKSQATLLQDPHMCIPPEGYHLTQTTTARRNKSEEALIITSGSTSSGNEKAVKAAKDQCKESISRHHIRSVPVCKSRQRRRIQQSLPESATHEIGTSSQDHNKADGTTQLHLPSLTAKKILLNGSWRDDPFNINGLVNNSRAALLLNHHQEAIASTWRPNVNRAFLIWNFSNESRHPSPQREVLHLINQSLDDVVFRTSDTIIAALGYLVIYEEMYGSHEAASFHRKGLRKLLHLRKDIQGPDLGYFLTKMLPITGIQHISEEEILTPVIDRTSQSTTSHSDLEFTPILVRVNIPSNAMYKIFAWLKNSLRIVSTLPLDANNRRKESYLVRTKIDGYLQHLDANPGFPKREMHLSWLTASKIYIHTITATAPELEMLHGTERGLVQQLRRALENIIQSPDGLDYSCPVLLWILLLGRLSAQESEATWYKEAIVMACNTMKVENWFEAKDLMQDLPWVQPHLEEKLRTFCLLDDKYGLVAI